MLRPCPTIFKEDRMISSSSGPIWFRWTRNHDPINTTRMIEAAIFKLFLFPPETRGPLSHKSNKRKVATSGESKKRMAGAGAKNLTKFNQRASVPRRTLSTGV